MALTGKDWFQFDDRCWKQQGTIYDLGCLGWDWTQPFIGKIPVVGVDPLEGHCPSGTVLIRAVVTPFPGNCRMHGINIGASLYPADGTGELVPAVTWQELQAAHGPANLVKMNIEGTEIPLLISVTHPMADQVIVSFHDWQPTPDRPPPAATKAMLDYLATWYQVIETFPKFRWFVLLKK